MRVFVTGASGFIGKRLLRELMRRGDQVVALTRNRRNLSDERAGEQLSVLEGDPGRAGDWQAQLAGIDAVLALAGEPLFGKRWDAAFKRRLVSSRVDGMARLGEAVAALPEAQRPKALIAASAVGYYGERGDEALDEDSPPGHDFLADLCQQWEAASQAASAHGLRVAQLRIGVVLGEGGGALEKMVPAFRSFVGGPLGSGKQYFPWIHLDDVIGLTLLALDNPAAVGSINLVAPQPLTMGELADALGRVLKRPSLLPVPSLALRLLVGEAAMTILGSQRVLPRRAEQLGYKFRYPELLAALRDLLQRPTLR